MATWSDLQQKAPDLAETGRRLLSPDGTGIAFLATVRRDGGPRVHPVAPILDGARLCVFVVNISPKYEDLLRDGRYALHALPPPGGGEEFYLTGRAAPAPGEDRRSRAMQASGGRLGHLDFEVLFDLSIEHVLHTYWDNWGTAKTWPRYRKWP